MLKGFICQVGLRHMPTLWTTTEEQSENRRGGSLELSPSACEDRIHAEAQHHTGGSPAFPSYQEAESHHHKEYQFMHRRLSLKTICIDYLVFPIGQKSRHGLAGCL